MQILIKSLIFRTLQIYIFSFYAFLFFVSLADAECLFAQRTVRRDVSANHLAGRAGGGDPGGASLRGDPAAASCQALPPSSAEAYRQESVKGYGGFTITPPDGRCIKKVEAIKLDLIQ